jgi:uncharacterized membrane protein (UPF0127 family)
MAKGKNLGMNSESGQEGFGRRRRLDLFLATSAWLAGIMLWGGWLYQPALAQALSPQGNPYVEVRLGLTQVRAEVVQAPEKIYLGLSHRDFLPEGQGMLFLMPETAVQVFCMRGMKFPLDIIWIREQRVVGLAPQVPADFPGDIPSPEPAAQVLEVPAGFCARHDIQVGDKVTWQPTW